LSGSRTKVETIGLDSLFNSEVIQNFLTSDRKIEKLPSLFVELYLDEQDNLDLNGKINSDNVVCDGLRLACEPEDIFRSHLKNMI
jgi:hypothetical protein